MRVRSVISYYLLLCLVVTSSLPTLSFIVFFAVGNAYANSDTPVLDDLRTKHNLADPNRNHTSDALPTSVQDLLDNPLTSRDMTTKINNVLTNPTTPRDYNLDSDDPLDNPYANSLQSTYQDHTDLAVFLGSSHGQPSGNVASNKLTDLNLEYAKSGTRQFVKDPVTGELQLQVITGVPRVSDLPSSELVSAEESNATYGFQRNKEDMYGNDIDIFDEGFVTDSNFKDTAAGQNGAARGYRAVVRGAVTANNEAQSPLYNENAGWLSDSFSTLNDSQEEVYWDNVCTGTSTTVTNTYSYFNSTEHTCQDSTEARMEFCEVERKVNVPILMQGGSLQSCGPGCYELEYGQTNNNYRDPPGGCGVYTDTFLVSMNLTNGIRLDRVEASGYVDDHMEVRVDGNLAFSVITGSLSFTQDMPDDTYYHCDSGYDSGTDSNGRWHMSGDMSTGFLPHFTPGISKNYFIDINHLVGGWGEINGSIKFYFVNDLGGGFDTEYTQYPDGCYDALQASDKLSKGLNGMPTSGTSSFCTFDDYSIMEEGTGGFPPEFLSEIPPFFTGDTGDKTFKVNLDGYRCDPTDDRLYCTVDALDGETCVTWDEWQAMPNECQVYEDNPDCTVSDSECAPGWTEPVTGRCLSETVTYQCEEEVVVTYDTEETTSVCESMLGCVGSDCNIGSEEQNDSFTEAMITGSILDNIEGDSACEDPTDPTTCELFAGEFEYCSWETTGLGTDCCEKASGADIIGYIILSRNLLKVNQMAYSGAFGSGVAGNYQTLSQPIVSAYDSVAQWASDGIRTASESIFGNTESVSNGVGAISDGVNLALAEVQQQVYQLVYDIAPDALKDFLFDNAAAYASDSTVDLAMNEAITNTLSSIMAVYTTYQMIKLALTLLTACDDNEIDMAVKLGQEQCFKVGNSYCSEDFLGVCYQKRQGHCCYSSILSRIIMKEAYTQLGINPLPYGNKPAMNTFESEESCPGLTTAQFSALDFDTPGMQAGIAEWTGLLLQAGALPTSTSEASLTGGASVTARTGCPVEQQPVLDCYVDSVTLQQVCDHARDANGNLMYTTGPSDCGSEITGGGQIWNAQDRDIASERIAGPNGYIGTAADRVQEAKDQMRTIPGAINCSTTPRPPQCYFGFNPADL